MFVEKSFADVTQTLRLFNGIILNICNSQKIDQKNATLDHHATCQWHREGTNYKMAWILYWWINEQYNF